MEEKYLAQLVEWIQSTSPLLLAAAKQKVAANVAQNVLWAVVGISASILFAWATRWMYRENEKSTDDDLASLVFLSGFLALTALVFSLVFMSNILSLYLAPDYATIQILTDLAKSAIK